jgi:hypothetical protein
MAARGRHPVHSERANDKPSVRSKLMGFPRVRYASHAERLA